MQRILLSGALAAGLLLALANVGYAHGGSYRGPGDVVPPNPGGPGSPTPGPNGPGTPGPNGPNTPGPNGPNTPGSSGPSTGVPGPSGGPGCGPRTPVGAPVGPDLTRWQFWWEFHKNPYINLKEAVHAGAPMSGSADAFLGGHTREDAIDSLQPSDSQINDHILPALKRALDSSNNTDIVSACLVALAKIGRDSPSHDIDVLDLMRQRLASRVQEVRETAALAMGISQMPRAIPMLTALAQDTERGRELCGRSWIDNRTRAFACYGLGLVAHATGNTDQKRVCFDALAAVLEETTDSWADRNLPVAAINGIRLVGPNPEAGDKDRALLGSCLDALWSYYTRDLGKGRQQIQAHVPTAVAQLLGRAGAGADTYRERFLGELTGAFGKRHNAIYQSAAIALGKMAQPRETDAAHAVFSDTLVEYSYKGRDEQTRYFSLIALARIGGAANRTALLNAFERGSKALVKPWAAIALGVLSHDHAREGELDITTGRTLHRALTTLKNDQTQSAIAIALGLCKYRDAADDIEALLVSNQHRDELAGYLCVSLALMDNRPAIETIRNIAQRSVRRPTLLQQAAIALGKMGDKTVANDLQKMLVEPSQNVAKLAAISSALGFIGDRRTVVPLKTMLQDETITPLSRAFAAAALGGVADKEPLPWNTVIAVDLNYRAAVETLTQSGSGVLDIL